MSVLGLLSGNPFIPLLAALTAAKGKKAGSKTKHNDSILKPHQNNDDKKHTEHKEAKPKVKVNNVQNTDSKIKKADNTQTNKKNPISDKKSNNYKNKSSKSDFSNKEKDSARLEEIINFEYKDIEKFQDEDLQQLGKKLILTGALLQKSLAFLINVETKKVNKTLKKLEADHRENLTVQDLHTINKSLAETICCIAEIEEKIIDKIRLGDRLVRENSPSIQENAGITNAQFVNTRDKGDRDECDGEEDIDDD